MFDTTTHQGFASLAFHPPHTMESLIVPATLDSLESISQFVSHATGQVGFDDHAAWQVQLAVDEAATNIIQHGYDGESRGTIELAWRLIDGCTIEISLRDHGRRFDPNQVPAPNITAPLEDRSPGGLGIFLMNQLMDTVEYTHSDTYGNTLVMTKRLANTGANVQVFALSGRLDAVASQHALERPLAASSSGLRALLLLRKDLLAHGGELRLCEMRDHVYEVFLLTGFTQVFTIHQTREEALAAFR
jgi:serine/threonine-protein kinase RsbW